MRNTIKTSTNKTLNGQHKTKSPAQELVGISISIAPATDAKPEERYSSSYQSQPP
jgi:hypothetical protein